MMNCVFQYEHGEELIAWTQHTEQHEHGEESIAGTQHTEQHCDWCHHQR